MPSYHVFCCKLSNGTEVHGHVRRYLPYHAQAGGRRDVGRRGVRALVILTRNSGGGHQLYSGLLKTLDVLTLKNAVASENGDAESGQEQSSEATKTFMHSVFREHVNVCRTVAAAKAASNDGSSTNKQVLSKPRFITVPMVELGRGHGLFGSLDTVKFVIPPSFLHWRDSASSVSGLSRNDMMPMLRCLGVVRTMRLLSALMAERRVIFTSNSVSKLSAVSYGAVAMMGQGLLPPPPLFIPTLAPGLGTVLGSEQPYLIGVLSGPTSNFINPRSIPNIGPVVIFDLDNSNETEPYYHNIADPHQFVPDLTRRNVEDMEGSQTSLPDSLYQDLTYVLSVDKKLFWQGAVQERLGAVATKGKTAAKAAMKKGLKYLKNKSVKDSMESSKTESATEDTEEEAMQPTESSKSKLVGKGNYFYEQGFSSEAAEVEARIAFSIFFVSLLGDLRSYLTQSVPGTPPVVDKMKFMKGRAKSGDYPGTAMFLLLGHFMRSKLFDEFAADRLKELQMRKAVAEDAPLFALVTNHHRSNKIAFYLANVRNSVKEIASSLPGRYLISLNESVRRRTSELTAMQAYSGDAKKALTQLTADCNESTTVLVHTMMILWTRTQEGKGLQWKKTYLALQIIRDLLLNGPITAVAEAVDGFASIHILREYREAMRAQNSALIRAVAREIYSLLVDLPVLFVRRRECMNKRWLLANPKPSPYRKETRMIKGISHFRKMHELLRPDGARIAPAPPTADLLQYPVAGESVPSNVHNDLLSMNVAAPQPPPQTNVDVFNMTAMSNAVSDSATAHQAAPTSVKPQIPQPVQNLPQGPSGAVSASPHAQMGQQTHQQQAQPQPSVLSQNHPQYPNGTAAAIPPAQMVHQAPQQPQQHQQQFHHSFSSVSNNGYQQSQQNGQSARPLLPQQQSFSNFAPSPNQPMYAQAQPHLSHSAPPTLIPGQGQQQQPPANPPKKAMNFDPFA